MKICNLSINNYKQFKNLNLNLTYPLGHTKEGQPLDKICIIGQSGTGKTNILDIIKKSAIDFSLNPSYKPFNEFTNKKNDDKFIKSEFISKSKINTKALFTQDDSKIEFSNDDNKLFEEYEKSYFVGTKDYSILDKEDGIEFSEDTEERMSSTDRSLWSKLTDAKIKLITDKKPSYLDSITSSTFGNRYIEQEMSRLESKYSKKNNINKSIKKTKEQNFIAKHIININDETNKLWETIREKIKNYEFLKIEYNEKISYKLRDTSDKYSQEDYINDYSAWENENENLLNSLSLKINYILNKFNLELSKIDGNQTTYNSFTIKDLANGNIIEYDNLSTGTKNLLSTFIPLKAYSPQDSIMLIDEPEMSFYPDIQKKLIELYAKIGENNQLIVATHSPVIASNFEPWEVVELKFDENNQIYRELYFKGKNHIDNYFYDPRLLTWTGILTDIFDLKEDSNFTFREKGLMEYATLKAEIKTIEDIEEKEKKFKKLEQLSKKLGLQN